SRGGRDAEDLSVDIFVDRSVVQYVGEPPVDVTDGQRIVRDEAFGKGLLVAFASFFRFREVIGEVRADQLFAGRAGDLDSSFVHIGDLAFRADGNQRVHADLDQAPRIL